MAAGTTECHAEKRPAEGVNLLVDHIHPQLLFILQLVVGRAEGEKSGGGELLALLPIIVVRQQVACDLLDDEAIVRLVGIE